jgi:hypothetical protein
MNTGRDGNDKRDFGTFTTAYSSESLDGQSTAFNSGPSQSFLCDTESTSSAGVDWDQSTQYGELPAGQKGRPFSGYSQALAPPPPPPFKPMMTYSEIGMEAFHHKGRIFISILFTLELFAAAVALIILIADSLHSLFPQQGLVPLKLLAFLVVTPTMWLPNLKYLSYGSVLGIIAMANLLVVVLIDGLTTTEQPGSLLRPEQTNLWCRHLFKLPISFGLIMSGFAGHAVFPNIYREMKEPHRFTSLLNTSYIITFVVYSTMATAGYLMFGEFTLDEITKNLAAVPFYNAALNTLTIWLIAINPMTKYALTLRPISTNFELWFLAHTNQSSNPATTLALSESYPLRLQLSAGWLVHVPFRMIQIMFRTHSIPGVRADNQFTGQSFLIHRQRYIPYRMLFEALSARHGSARANDSIHITRGVLCHGSNRNHLGFATTRYNWHRKSQHISIKDDKM